MKCRALEAARMDLLGQLREWTPRFRLLFPHRRQKSPSDSKQIAHLERWLIREGHWDLSIPRTIEEAQDKVRATVIDIRDLTNLLPSDDYPARLAVDTNALLDNPDLPRTQGAWTEVSRPPATRRSRGDRRPQARRKTRGVFRCPTMTLKFRRPARIVALRLPQGLREARDL